jgi:hypothetical protein
MPRLKHIHSRNHRPATPVTNRVLSKGSLVAYFSRPRNQSAQSWLQRWISFEVDMGLAHQFANALAATAFVVGMIVMSQAFIGSRSAQGVAVGVQMGALPL